MTSITRLLKPFITIKTSAEVIVENLISIEKYINLMISVDCLLIYIKMCIKIWNTANFVSGGNWLLELFLLFKKKMWIPNLAKVICIVLQRLKEKKCAFWCVCQHFMIYIKSLPAHLYKHICKLFFSNCWVKCKYSKVCLISNNN